MTDILNSELAEKLRKMILERMPPGGTRKDAQRIVEDIILGDDDDRDEGPGGEIEHQQNGTDKDKKLPVFKPGKELRERVDV